MNRKITLSDAVYEGLHRIIAGASASSSRDSLSPTVVPEDIEASYRDMAADQTREQEALEWSEGVIAESSFTEPHASR